MFVIMKPRPSAWGKMCYHLVIFTLLLVAYLIQVLFYNNL